MADPLSLAASVAGLVSLGLQVTSGITKYLDAVKCRDEELSEIRRQNGLLKDTLGIIEKTATQLDQVPPDVAATTQRTIESHHDSLNKLETLVAQLASSDVGTWRARLKDKAGKLHYAFDRPKLQELCHQATQTQSALQLALEGLGVSLTVATHGSLQAGFGSVHHQLQDSFQAARGQVFTSTRILSQQLHQTEDTIQSSFSIQHGYLDRIQVQNTDLVGRVAGMERTLQTLTAHLLNNYQLDDQTSLLSTVTQLVAKPAVLREYCDILPSQTDMASTFRNPCVCGRRKQTCRKYSQLGSWFLYSDVSTDGHLPYCPMSKRVTPKVQQTYGLRYTGLARAIKAAIGVSFDMRSGAGGWSVGPNFSYYPTVDAENDQTFRIMKILHDVFSTHEFSGEAANAFHQKALRKIVRLLAIGKTSPLAVDHCNQTLMHVAFGTYIFNENKYLLGELVQTLMLHGVPPITYDIWGNGPGVFQNAPGTSSWMPRRFIHIVDSLAIIADVEGGTMPLTLVSESIQTFGISPYHPELALSPSLAEASGCGPLSMAILARDIQLAQSLLEKHPASIVEVNLFGHTPLHIAAFQNGLPGFPFILEAAKAAGLLQRKDNKQQTALFAALVMTKEHCRATNQTSECTQCSCVDSLIMLFETGSVVCGSDFSRLGLYQYRLSLRGWRAFLTQLKAQRENLKELALRNPWAVEEYLDVLQSAQILDLHAYAVYESLRRHGIDVPMDLVPSDYANTGRSYSIRRKTIYDCISTRDESKYELSFELGFEDIDFDIQYGLPPLCRAYSLSFINWLIRRGADLKRRIWPSGNEQLQTGGIFSAHFVLYRLSPECMDLFGALEEAPLYGIQQLVPITTRALPLSLADSCRCACSTEGCTPFLFLLKAQHGWRKERVVADIDRIAKTDFRVIFDGFSTEITRSLCLATMRFVGFITLELTHTCCNTRAIVEWEEPYQPRDHDEVDEIQEEESELIKVLEDMVAEFQNIIANISGDSALSQFQTCWEDFWTDRVPEILEELEGHRMTDIERQDAELIGVVWKSETNKSKASEDIRRNPYDFGTIDYWYYELDSITEDG